MKLDEHDHRALMLWAADCAERVLPFFEERHPGDDRPRNAIEVGRAWARGGLGIGEARAAAVAAHAAARAAGDGAARAAARAAGHAAATAHVAAHAPHAADYALKAVTAAPAGSAAASARERDHQYQHLPARARSVLFPNRAGT
jgi:hypothetical protein